MSDCGDTSQPHPQKSPCPQKNTAGFVLVGVLLPLCWLGMMVVHEAGHVAGAALTGGRVAQVVLHPLAISRTDVEPNPHPLLVTWAGPVIGLLLPIVLWSALRAFKSPATFLARFFTGFCAVANGLYLGVGSFNRIGDAGDLLRSGARLWHLWLFGVLATLAGFRIWHGQAKSFGFGGDPKPVSWQQVSLVAVLLTVVVVLELALA